MLSGWQGALSTSPTPWETGSLAARVVVQGGLGSPRDPRPEATSSRPNRLTASALSTSQGLSFPLPDLAAKQKVSRTGLAAVSLPSGAQPPLSTVSRPLVLPAATLLLPVLLPNLGRHCLPPSLSCLHARRLCRSFRQKHNAGSDIPFIPDFQVLPASQPIYAMAL